MHTIGGCAASAALPNTVFGSAQKKRPNIVVIFADDMGYGDVNGFGSNTATYQTPNLNKMASEGVKLTQVYVPFPYCAPSRATILTGRYPFRTGVVHNPAPDAGMNDVGLPRSEITIAKALKTVGYATSCIGKWHLGHKTKYLPRNYGFDEYLGILYSNDMRPAQLIENEKVIEYPVVQATITKRYTQKALDFIENSHNNDQPFFLYLPHAMPHKPLAASEDFYTPETLEDLYADVIRELDWSVGSIMKKLKDLGIDDDTLVIFTSDNGPWYGGSTGGFRGMKGQTWEGGLRVPFISRWPGKIPQGIVNNAAVGTIDIFPTLLKIAGVDIPKDRVIDGKDILPILTSEKTEDSHDVFFAMKGTRLAVVRSGPWKLHLQNPGSIPKRGKDWVDPRAPDGVTLIAQFEQARPEQFPGTTDGDAPKAMMLFNLENDPSEKHDLSQKHPDIVKRLKKIADKTIAEFPVFKKPKRYKSIKRITGGRIDFAD